MTNVSRAGASRRGVTATAMQRQTLATRIAKLSTLPRSALTALWIEKRGDRPPSGLSRRLLELALAHELQTGVLGGLKPAIRKRLRETGAGSDEAAAAGSFAAGLTPGTRLVRQWQGRTHTVEVLADGFLYQGSRYRSLSEIARTITGTRWSGPRFFQP